MCIDTDAETCSRCYSFWCMGFGGIMFLINLLVGITLLRGSEPVFFGEPVVMIVLFIIGILGSIASFVAGLLLWLGMERDKKTWFNIGKILSYIAPIIYFFLIMPLVFLVIGVLNLSEYSGEQWP